jgi:hypothetical protein
VIVLAVFAVVERQRLYVRDPLAKVTQDGAAATSVWVFINYSNDVLLEHDASPRYVTLVQHGQPVGSPHAVTCLHGLACMTEADVAPLLAGSESGPATSMDSRSVAFRDTNGHAIVVTLW